MDNVSKFNDFDDEYQNPFKKAIEEKNESFFEFRKKLIGLCEEYESKLSIKDIVFILNNVSSNAPVDDWRKKK